MALIIIVMDQPSDAILIIYMMRAPHILANACKKRYFCSELGFRS